MSCKKIALIRLKILVITYARISFSRTRLLVDVSLRSDAVYGYFIQTAKYTRRENINLRFESEVLKCLV